MKTKICTTCKLEKDLDLFYNSKNGKFGKTYSCKNCMSSYRNKNKERSRKYMEDLRKNDNDRVKEVRRRSYHKDPVKKLYLSAKNRSKRYNIPFNIQLEDIIIPEVCPLLEVPFIPGTKDNYQYGYSLDRIDNTKGYIKGNIQVITSKANSMKNNATFEELEVFCKNILKSLDNDIV